MFKKTLLSALLIVSTLATAQINLDLDVTITNQVAEHHATGAIVVEENVTTSVVFDGLDALVVNFRAQTDNEIIDIHVQFFQKTDDDEFVAATEPVSVQVPFGQPATVTVNDTDNDGSLVLIITPTFVE